MAVLSFNYHYYVDDLVAPQDFGELATLILAENDQLPTAPPLYHHKDAFSEICEEKSQNSTPGCLTRAMKGLGSKKNS